MKKQEDEIPRGYLRVTQVLEPFSKLDTIDKDTLANAADRGTRVHTFCEMHALNLFVDEYDEDCKNYVDSFKEWYDSMVVKLLYNEKRLNSAKYRISGKFDMVVQLKGDPDDCFTLLDIKTPASVSQSWSLQTAAYQILLSDEMNFKVHRRICLQLPKQGGQAKVVEFLKHEEDQRLYLAALSLYRHFNG